LSVPLNTLQVLAENTGGRAIHSTNDPGIGLRKLGDDLSSYYLLGYSSTNPAMDGRYRRIEVKVRQPHVDVAARHGYLAAIEAPASLEASRPAVAAEITDELGRLARLRSDTPLQHYAVVRPDRLEVVIELTPDAASRLGRAGVDVDVRALSEGGAAMTGRARLGPGERSTRVQIPVTGEGAGPWRVSVRATGSSGDLSEQFAITSPAADQGAMLGLPLIFRAGTAASATRAPVASFQFLRSERLHIEWPAHGRIDERVARLLDRRGQPLAVPVATAERDGAVSADVGLAPLAEGDYLVELSAAAAGRSERSLVAFRVVR
jgi:hypothetical protein